MDRTEALDLLKTHVESQQLLRHCFAVEAAMKGYAKVYGEDEALWGILGLLHDIDFEKHPDTHPKSGAEWLRAEGFDESFVLAVLGHSDKTQTPRETLMAKTLYAVDEMASFIVAVALVRPEKLEGLSAKSVKKKLKDKAFARAVDRSAVLTSSEALGVDFTLHIERVILALQEGEAFLNGMGESLLA